MQATGTNAGAGCRCSVIGDLRRIATSSLKGSSSLAELLQQEHVYAIGMPHGLNRELLVLDSKAYHSYFDDDLTYRVEEISDANVAFLGYAVVPAWAEYRIPDDVREFAHLETWIADFSLSIGLDQSSGPIPFKIVAEAWGLRWFVVGGEGNGQPTPRDAFLRSKFQGGLNDCSFEGFGFYTKNHRGNVPEHPMATSPVSDVHMHFRTTTEHKGRPFLAHLDDHVLLKPGGRIYFPQHVSISSS
jgi:hypothetical protein